MLLIDVHAHMDLEGYEVYGGVDKVIEESVKNGVKVIISNGTDVKSNRRVLEIAKKHPTVKVALGIYPTHCLEMIEAGEEELFESELRFIEDQIKHKKCIAIGEVGLEYKEIKDIDENKKDIQKSCLKRFLDIAKRYDVPIILHSRGAELELVELLEHEGMKGRKIVMHCFSGRKHIIQKVRDNDWYFSIPCNLARSQHFQSIVENTPVQRLFTETDSPYISPTPGTVNRPDNVLHTVQKIAEMKKITPEEASNIIYANYQRIFL
jgi:TatD DNase family protein